MIMVSNQASNETDDLVLDHISNAAVTFAETFVAKLPSTDPRLKTAESRNKTLLEISTGYVEQVVNAIEGLNVFYAANPSPTMKHHLQSLSPMWVPSEEALSAAYQEKKSALMTTINQVHSPLKEAERAAIFETLYKVAESEFIPGNMLCMNRAKSMYSALTHFFGDNSFAWAGYLKTVAETEDRVSADKIFDAISQQSSHAVIQHVAAEYYVSTKQIQKATECILLAKKSFSDLSGVGIFEKELLILEKKLEDLKRRR